jgi:hypothetical protein
LVKFGRPHDLRTSVLNGFLLDPPTRKRYIDVGNGKGVIAVHPSIRNFIIILMLAGLIWSVAAQQPPSEQPASSPDRELYRYVPLAPGQWRQYDRSYWSIVYGSAWVEEITQTVLGTDTVLDGRLAYILKDEGVSYDSIWVVFTDDEVRRYEDYPQDYSDYKVILKLPLKKGNWWAFNPFPVNGDTMWAFIQDTDVTVKALDLEFDHCLHVFAMPFYHYWFKPGIGIVRFSSAESDSLTGTDDDLVNWDVGE